MFHVLVHRSHICLCVVTGLSCKDCLIFNFLRDILSTDTYTMNLLVKKLKLDNIHNDTTNMANKFGYLGRCD